MHGHGTLKRNETNVCVIRSGLTLIRRGCLAVAVLAVMTVMPVSAFGQQSLLFSTPVKSLEEIRKMSDQELIDTFIDVMVDIEASTVFSQAAGFTKKDFDQYKRLLKYRVYLIQEFQRRKLPIPKIQP